MGFSQLTWFSFLPVFGRGKQRLHKYARKLNFFLELLSQMTSFWKAHGTQLWETPAHRAQATEGWFEASGKERGKEDLGVLNQPVVRVVQTCWLGGYQGVHLCRERDVSCERKQPWSLPAVRLEFPNFLALTWLQVGAKKGDFTSPTCPSCVFPPLFFNGATPELIQWDTG